MFTLNGYARAGFVALGLTLAVSAANAQSKFGIGKAASDAEIKACLANEAKANDVIADYRGGEAIGVNSTPSLFINGTLYKGARSVDELDATFAKLAK